MIVITVARKPFPKTLRENIQEHGTGGLNIDACRVTPTGEWLGGGDERPETIAKKQSHWSQPWMHRPEDAKRHAEMMKEDIQRHSLMGRFPANVILEHNPDCVSLGLAKIKGSPQVNVDKLPVEERIQSGEQHGHIWGRGKGIGVKGVSYTMGFGDESGQESIESWECVDGCPVRQIDVQSGNSLSSGGRTANISTTSQIYGGGKGLGQGLLADDVRGDPGYGDLGGASRYFKQVKREPEKDGINVLSLFDGISCGQVALKRLGIKVNKYFASEIDKYAISITQHNFPDTVQLGDVTGVFAKDLPKIDLVIGGSPCQGFSMAGKQLNFDDPRSKLFFEYVRLLKECDPKYFLLENVKMKAEYEYIITDILKVNRVIINSNRVSAQNRQRLYWTNIPGDEDLIISMGIGQPEDKKIQLKDILENGVVDREKSHCLDASYYKSCNWAYYMRKSRRQVVFPDDNSLKMAQDLFRNNPNMPRTDVDKVKYRQLTPLECERLQTLPEGYTAIDGLSRMQRYRCMGNGWTVDVIAHIFKNMDL